MADTAATATTILTYKGHPLIRKENILYYGNMKETYIIMLQVMDSEPLQDITLAKKVAVYLQHTDPTVRAKDRILKKSEKDGLYNAMDIAAIWLERALSGK